MPKFNEELNRVLKYAVSQQELRALAAEAQQADRESNNAGRIPGPINAAGVLADLLADHNDPREMIVRRSQERRQKAMDQDIHPVSLNGDSLVEHIGEQVDPTVGGFEHLDEGGPQEEHHYADGSLLRSIPYVHTKSGKRVHWAYWDVPALAPDSEPHPQFHHFGAPLTDEELEQLRSIK